MSNVIGKDKSNILEVLELMEKERRFNFKEESSLFIEAMTQGEWVLLNGIEFAQPELFEKIMNLCDNEFCSFNLFEKGNKYKYSRKEETIHKDFKLFITYNPFIVETNKRLSPGFLNKCLVFSVFPIDENILDISLLLYKSFENNEALKNIKKKLAVILTSIHFKCKELSEDKNNILIGKKKINGKTLLSAINYINQSGNNIEQGIISAINDCYLNCFMNKKEIKKILLSTYSSKPNKEILDNLDKEEKTFEEKYPDLNDNLILINDEFDNNNLIEIINLIYKIEFLDIFDLIKKIKNNLLKIKNNTLLYTSLYIIKNILNIFLSKNKLKNIELKEKKIEDNDLDEEILLLIHKKYMYFKEAFELNYIIPFKFEDFSEESKYEFFIEKINNGSFEDLITLCFIFPDLENKEENKEIIKQLSQYKKDLFYIILFLCKGKIEEPNLILILQRLKIHSLFQNNNNENNDNENIENIIITDEEKMINKIFENWKNKYSILIQKVQEALGQENEIINIDKEIDKYKELLSNKRKDIPYQLRNAIILYIKHLESLLNDINISDKFKILRDNFNNYQKLVQANLTKNKKEIFDFSYYLDENEEPSKDLKMIEELIYYSIIKNNLEKIGEKRNESFWEIYEIIEKEKDLKDIIKDFFDFLFSSKKENINEELYRFESLYKAYLLKKIGVELLDKNYIINCLNELSKRDNVKRNK